jgi:hypothetical protein
VNLKVDFLRPLLGYNLYGNPKEKAEKQMSRFIKKSDMIFFMGYDSLI